MHMIDLHLDAGRLARFAGSQGIRQQDDDYGYSAHAWLAATFGDMALQPFRVIDKRGLRMLAYAAHNLGELKSQAGAVADPAAYAVCDWEESASKEMPLEAFATGRTFNFEVRACPVSRNDRGERDLYLAEIEHAKEHSREPRTREQAYADWLGRQIGKSGGADVLECSLTGFRRVRSTRKTQSDGNRKAVSVERPDALFAGRLRITDQGQFARLLSEGIGRHRSFGYGMLLIRP